MRRLIAALVLSTAVVALRAQQPQQPQQFVTVEQVDGITNFAHLETTVACSGAISATAVPDIKKMGFVSIFNLREASEPGANIEAEAAAAKAAGLKFFHIPLNGQMPDAKAVDQFLDAIASPGAQPAFIHCQAGNRAATMWAAKRLVIDHWTPEQTMMEAGPLGLTSPRLQAFVVEYAKTHPR